MGTVEFGEGTSTAHVQIAASVLGTTPVRVHLVQSDTDRTGFDTGAFASAGLFVSGNAVQKASTALRDSILRFAAGHTGVDLAECAMADDAVKCGSVTVSLTELLAAARDRRIRFSVSRKAYGSPRSVTSNAHGFRIAVHGVTGEIRILHSVHATDAGVVINPAQVRGQIEGGVAQAIGFALTENFHVDGNGVMTNPNLRNYRIPTYADIPRTEVLVVEYRRLRRPDGRQGDRRVERQPGGPCPGERAAGRDRRAVPRAAADTRADLPQARREPTDPRQLMGTENATDTAATIIIGQNVRAGLEQPYQEWQKDLNREASKYPGFLGAEINPPTAVQQEWVVVYRFNSIPHVMAWLNSATRQERLAVGRQFFEGPGTQQVLGGGAREADPLVTVAVSHRVGQEDVEEFLDWQDRLRVAESRFPGFRGTELFRPVAGVQEEWTALYRYDSAADLDRWLVSDERKTLLAEGEKFADFHSRTIDNSFGSWFAFDEQGETGPSVGDQDIASRYGSACIPPSCSIRWFCGH